MLPRYRCIPLESLPKLTLYVRFSSFSPSGTLPGTERRSVTMVSITVERAGVFGWKAFLTNDTKRWSYGQTKEHAIGALLLEHGSEIGTVNINVLGS